MRISDWSSDVCSSDLLDDVRRWLRHADVELDDRRAGTRAGIAHGDAGAARRDVEIRIAERRVAEAEAERECRRDVLCVVPAVAEQHAFAEMHVLQQDRKSTRLNSSH